MMRIFKAIDKMYNETVTVIKCKNKYSQVIYLTSSYDNDRPDEYKTEFKKVTRQDLYEMSFPIDVFEGINTPLEYKGLPF